MAQNKDDDQPSSRNTSSMYQLTLLGNGAAGTDSRIGEGEHEEDKHDERRQMEEDLSLPEMIQDILGPEEDTQCGCGVLRGKYLQRLARPLTYLLLSSVVALVQGIFYTYANATLSTIEKRFHLPSKLSGLVTTGNDVVQLVVALPLTFIAGRGHRPRWMALGMMGAVVGCVLAAAPHFMFGPGDSNSHTHNNITHKVPDNMLCSSSSKDPGGGDDDDECSGEGDSGEGEILSVEQYTVITLHLIAQMLAGVASLLYYSVGYTYLDDAVSKDKIPLFLAVSGSVRILGPVCGYSLAAWSLSMWVSPSLPPTSLSPSHPHWIGAWWIGYLVVGVCLCVVSWWLLLLPKTLPGARQRALQELREAANKGTEALYSLADTLRPHTAKGYHGMVSSLRRLGSNRVFLLVCINQAFFWFAFFGYITFKPKFLEHQFKMSAARANQYIAGAALAATLAGWLVTGAALTLLKPKTKMVLVFMIILSFINCVLHLCMVNISCDHDVIHGMDLVLQERTHPHNTTHTLYREVSVGVESAGCSSQCECTGRFSPVCVDGAHNFYSGCHAGCSSLTKLNGSRVYENCTCIPDHSQESSSWAAVEGYCHHNCPTFYMYLTLTVLTKMTLAASRVPLNIILFRCVEERDKDLGLGVFNAVIALAASIPAPIVFGWAIDSSCRLWEETCGERGFCWLYDLESFRRILHGIPAGMMLCCLVTEVLLLTLHKTIHLYGRGQEKCVVTSTPATDQPSSITTLLDTHTHENTT